MKKTMITALAAIATFGVAGVAHAATVDAVVLPIGSNVNQDNAILSDNVLKVLSENESYLSDNVTTVSMLSNNTLITDSAIADDNAVAYSVDGGGATLLWTLKEAIYSSKTGDMNYGTANTPSSVRQAV